MERGLYLIVYDVMEDKRRLKVAGCLEALGERVQKSVFEAYLTPAELEKLMKRLAKLACHAEDSVRVYDLCATCRGKVRQIGHGQVSSPPGPVVI